jgi:hypothetical protein
MRLRRDLHERRVRIVLAILGTGGHR